MVIFDTNIILFDHELRFLPGLLHKDETFIKYAKNDDSSIDIASVTNFYVDYIKNSSRDEMRKYL